MNGGTANYPATGPSNYPLSSQKASTTSSANGYPPTRSGYGATNGLDTNYHGRYSHHHHGNNVNEKAGFVNNNNGGYGNAYVQGAPVAYGSDGRPIVRKNHRLRNAILGTLAVCCCCIAL